jgi:3-methyladenine DNA glycosylase Mpg
VGQSARVGVDYAGEWKDAPLRFYDDESPCVSRLSAKRRAALISKRARR